MYRYSVNLSIAHYPRRNSIADAYMKPVFVITCVRIDLFPDETYFTLFICVTLSSSLIFFALHHATIVSCFYFVSFSRATLKFCFFLNHPYLIWIYSYHSYSCEKVSRTLFDILSLEYRSHSTRVEDKWDVIWKCTLTLVHHCFY